MWARLSWRPCSGLALRATRASGAPHVTRSGIISGQNWSTPSQHWPNSGRLRSKQHPLRSIWADLGPKSTKSGSSSTDVGQGGRPSSADQIWPTTNLRSDSANLGPTSCQARLSSTNFGETWTQLGPMSVNFGLDLTTLDRIWANATHFAPNQVVSRAKRASTWVEIQLVRDSSRPELLPAPFAPNRYISIDLFIIDPI